jgi:hypothetical protein
MTIQYGKSSITIFELIFFLFSFSLLFCFYRLGTTLLVGLFYAYGQKVLFLSEEEKKHIFLRIKYRHWRAADLCEKIGNVLIARIDRISDWRKSEKRKKKDVRIKLIKSSIVIGYEKIPGPKTAGISLIYFDLIANGPARCGKK